MHCAERSRRDVERQSPPLRPLRRGETKRVFFANAEHFVSLYQQLQSQLMDVHALLRTAQASIRSFAAENEEKHRSDVLSMCKGPTPCRRRNSGLRVRGVSLW